MHVAIQGQIESFHHQAARQWYGDGIELVCKDTFKDVMRSVDQHEADAAVMAIENSLYGSINEVYDLIESHGYPIVGEVHLRVEQQLVTHANDLKDITHIYSHPVALAQCANYLDNHLPSAERIEWPDTAGAVEHIATTNASSYAAIASRGAASLCNVPILAENIEDNPANFTRFLVMQPNTSPPKDADRASIVITTSHEPGALAKILSIIADAGINLSKLQSRPIQGDPWKYRFYIVVDAAGGKLHQTLSKLEPFTRSINILGEYKHNL